MDRTLIICEKPSVAADVAKALYGAKATKKGDHYESDDAIIAFAVGHIVEQADPDAYDPKYKKWVFEDLPIIPEEFAYEPRKNQKTKLNGLHKLMARKDVTEIVNACDAGREGELIFKELIYTAPDKARGKPIRRAWFSSLTKDAIRDAFDNLRSDDEVAGLEAAAVARSEADWLVGMNGTRAATSKGGWIRRNSRNEARSLGRVQTPTLALIVKRDLEINAFVPEDYWLVEAAFETGTGAEYPGRYRDGSVERIKAEEPAVAIADASRGNEGVVAEVTKKPQTKQPDLLYDLTSLQRAANGRFGYSAKRTLDIAQRLYESHKVLTYPRTNSRYLSGDLVSTLKPTASQVGAAAPEYAEGARYVVGLDKLPLGRIVNDDKVGDHHAIIPTNADQDLSALSKDERNIYDLVARRFLAAFHPPARFENTTVMTRVGENMFRSTGRVIIDAGWQAVEPVKSDSDPTELPPLNEGDTVLCAGVEVLAKQTNPPARYSEGTLLRAMETAGKLVDDDEAAEAMKDAGLGTPATRAGTIETLLDRGYVEREKRTLRATDTGIGIIKVLGDHDLTSPELTGRWEQRLNQIERGEEDPQLFRAEIEQFTREVVQYFADKEKEHFRIERRPIAPCPTEGCEGEIVEYPKSWGCNTYKGKDDPGCGYTLWKQNGGQTLTLEEALEHIAAGRSSKDIAPERVILGPCPSDGCGGEIIERGKGYGCTSWSRKDPGCGYVIWKKAKGVEVDLEAATAMVAKGETNAAKPPPKEPLGPCPTEGCTGEILEKRSNYGCSTYKSKKNPGCGYTIWKKVRGKPGEEIDRETATTMVAEANAAAESDSGSSDEVETPAATRG